MVHTAVRLKPGIDPGTAAEMRALWNSLVARYGG